MTRPRWLIDDTASIEDGRVFVIHTYTPRFVGELMATGEEEASGVTFGTIHGQSVCRIEWHDPPVFDREELLESLAEALERHDRIRGSLS